MKSGDFPSLYEAADAASLAEQKKLFLALGLYLLCLVLAAVMSFIDGTSGWFSLAQGFTLLCCLSLSIYLAYSNPQKYWYAARALAESVKTTSWRYMMKAEPFEDEGSANEKFIKTLREVFESNKHAALLNVEILRDQQITERMLHCRAMPLAQRINVYRVERISDQYDWYKKQASSNRRWAKFLFVVVIAANTLGLLLAFSRFLFPQVEDWPIDVFLGFAAAAMVWLQVKRYQELSASYSLAAHEISFICEQIPATDSEREFSVFVADSENAFSREHTQWSARRDK